MGVMSDHNARAFGAAARAFRRSAGTLGSGSSPDGAISSVTTSPASAPAASRHLPVHSEAVASLAVWLERGSKGEAIDGAFDRRHALRGELRTSILWQGKKGPGADLRGRRRAEEFRSETDL